jgi:hypothetical protein
VDPLPGLMSRLLVAYTIEFDNEVERRLVHRTSRGPAAGGRGPWLISQPFWVNFLRLLADGRPRPLAELPAELINLGGLERWGHIAVGPAPDRIVTLKPGGRRTVAVCAEVAEEVETRWRKRFGTGAHEALAPLADPALPRHLPMITVSRPAAPPPRLEPEPATDLSALLARALLAFTGNLAGPGRLPMGLGSNVLRVVTPEGVRSRDLPVAAGISREAVSISLKTLRRLEAITVESGVVVLTERGGQLRRQYARMVGEVAAARHEAHPRLAATLAGLLDRRDDLVAALTPPPDGWRANSPYRTLTAATLEDPARRLPAYPLVTHRGGFPDGS